MSRLFPLALLVASTTWTFTAPAQQAPEVRAYESCSFPDGLQVMDMAPMPVDVHARPVQIHSVAGSVPLLAGERVVFGYDGTAYANVKVEQLPATNFAANRKLLLDDFADIAASDKGVSRNVTRKPTQSGFSVVGLDRRELQGSTLGIYLLIDDATHVAATVYLLNADPAKRRFKTMDDYTRMRDTFLYNYTRCVRNNQTGNVFGSSR
ncbi:MAG: hypothetical protein ACRYF4_12515 [Janthinobacterium lividum]